MTQNNNLTTGQIYDAVIPKERRGEYLGATVQVIPHITDEIKAARPRRRRRASTSLIVEIGGTVGDIESLPFLEAIRQLRDRARRRRTRISVHVTLVPYIAAAGELKTKPTQHSVKELREIGIQPRRPALPRGAAAPAAAQGEDRAVLQRRRRTRVIAAPDVDCIYELPVRFRDEGLDDKIAELLNIWSRGARSGRVAARRRAHQAAHPRQGRDRRRRQVRAPARLVQEPQRGAGPRRRSPTTRAWSCATSTPRRSSATAPPRCSPASTASWSRAASAIAGSRARSWRSATRARPGCPSSASASACRSRSSSSRATSAGSAARTRPSSPTRRRTRSSTSCPTSAA